MHTYLCPNECCSIYVKLHIPNKKLYKHGNRRKAGVFIEDKTNNKVLLIQSNGNLWGPPKGTAKYGETDRKCAIREVFEETGLTVSDEEFTRAINIQNRALYFYINKEVCPVILPINEDNDNDATGITWINPDCLENCVVNGNIKLSQHCRIVFNNFCNKTFSTTSTFTLVNDQKFPQRF
jgi:ADP-ribose pyrophosphatase YjhB (NUDIX family)